MEHAERPHPNYWGVFIGLAVLTAVELFVARMAHWPKNIIILLLVFLAVWKAVMVALYFMHLRFETNRLRIMVVAPLPLAVILVVAVIQEFR